MLIHDIGVQHWIVNNLILRIRNDTFCCPIFFVDPSQQRFFVVVICYYDRQHQDIYIETAYSYYLMHILKNFRS